MDRRLEPATITICERCLWPPRPPEQWVPHDGPCGEGCEENETGCHCGEPRPVEMDRAAFIIRVIDRDAFLATLPDTSVYTADDPPIRVN